MRYVVKETRIECYDPGRETTRSQTGYSVTAVCDEIHEDGQPCPYCFGKRVSAVPEGAWLVEDTGFVGEGRVTSRQRIYED